MRGCSSRIQRPDGGLAAMVAALRPVCVAALLGVLAASSVARGDDEPPAAMVCLTPREARSAVAEGRALAFAPVKRSAESSSGGEVLRARLCEIEGRLAYVLTLLRHGGQVITMIVDAGNGATGSTRPGPRPSRPERRGDGAPSG